MVAEEAVRDATISSFSGACLLHRRDPSHQPLGVGSDQSPVDTDSHVDINWNA